jgi:hypothetical protein
MVVMSTACLGMKDDCTVEGRQEYTTPGQKRDTLQLVGGVGVDKR